jgi:hypothetical protein
MEEEKWFITTIRILIVTMDSGSMDLDTAKDSIIFLMVIFTEVLGSMIGSKAEVHSIWTLGMYIKEAGRMERSMVLDDILLPTQIIMRANFSRE